MYTRLEWIRHLDACADAAPSAAEDARPGAELDLVRAVVTGAPLPAPRSREDPSMTLWRARADDAIDWRALVDVEGAGPLFEQTAYRTIEVWTDEELAALHALWWIARDRGDAPLAARIAAARDWHLDHTQPDHATHRPWAIHVFLETGTPEGALYAEGLLHAGLAPTGRADALGGLLLRDAARGLK